MVCHYQSDPLADSKDNEKQLHRSEQEAEHKFKEYKEVKNTTEMMEEEFVMVTEDNHTTLEATEILSGILLGPAQE